MNDPSADRISAPEDGMDCSIRRAKVSFEEQFEVGER